MKFRLRACLDESWESLSSYLTAFASLQATIVNIVLMVLIVPAAHSGSRFELGQMHQATPVKRGEYVVPVTVSADGYSTFSASIYASANVMQRIRWQTIERQSGVNVVISVTKPIVTPERITLVAYYQGQERIQEYWLQPVPAPPQQKIPQETQPATIERKQANNAKQGKNAGCPELVIRAGSLRANIERLTAHCGHRLGIWYPGDSQDLVDWVVEVGRRLENNKGAAGLLDMLKEDYRLLGVMRSEGGDRYIDYYELPGGQGDETR